MIIRSVLIALALTSIGSLLAHIYGIAPMAVTAPWIVAPATAAIVAIALWARRRHADLWKRCVVGFWGGLAGTIAYDLYRVPFALSGTYVFKPISIFGMWILDDPCMTPGAVWMGWLYHFSNGLSFGLIYAMVATGRSWGWGVVWGVFIELVVVLTPFAALFGITRAVMPIAIAVSGHIAYGAALGWLAQHDGATFTYAGKFRTVGIGLCIGAVLVGAASWIAPRPDLPRYEIVLDENGFHPNVVRMRPGDTVAIHNQTGGWVTVSSAQVPAGGSWPPGPASTHRIFEPGIHQITAEYRRTADAFVVVESWD